MYPRNAASPPKIAVGPVVQISDGAVQTSGVSVVVSPEGGTETAGGGTVSYGGSSGIVYYVPTQAETNYTAFAVVAYKASCIPTAVTVVTTASATSGQVVVGTNNDKTGYALAADQAVNVTKIAGAAVSASTAQIGVNVVNWKGSAAAAMTGDAFARLGAPAGASVSADVAAVKAETAAIVADTGTDGVKLAADQAVNVTKWGNSAVGGMPNSGKVAVSLAAADVTGNVPADVKAYTVQPTVTAATLSAAYDAAKTAASAANLATVDTVVDGLATTLGVAGAGLTALGDTRLANLDATVSSRTKPADTQAAVTTVTNLTNAPTNGDLTATMKASVTTAVPTAAAIRAEVDASSTQLAAIVADTSEVQTELANGGRLDLLIDGIAAKTVTLPALPAATGDIPTAAAVAAAVWEEPLAGHADAGSAGNALATASSGGVDPSVLADAVWDEPLVGHATAGTAGQGLSAANNGNPPTVAAIRAEIDANSTQLAAIVADTSEVQTDLANGGRLDLLIDGVKAKTDTIPAQPAAVGSAMTLTAAYDAAKTAAPAGTALSTATWTGVRAGKLDNLDAAVTTRSSHSAAEVKTAVEAAGSTLAQIAEDTGTTLPGQIAGLEAGSGGDATAANQATILAALAAVQEDTGTTLPAQIAGIVSGAPVNVTIEPQVGPA